MPNTGRTQLVTKEIKPNQECKSVRAFNCNTTLYTRKSPTHLLCMEKGRTVIVHRGDFEYMKSRCYRNSVTSISEIFAFFYSYYISISVYIYQKRLQLGIQLERYKTRSCTQGFQRPCNVHICSSYGGLRERFGQLASIEDLVIP